MKIRWAIAGSVLVGLGLAAWIERDRVAGLADLTLARLQTGERGAVAQVLPPGEVPDSGQSQAPPGDPDHHHGPETPGKPGTPGTPGAPETPDPMAPLGTATGHQTLPKDLDGLFAALRSADTLEQANRIEQALFMMIGSSQGGTVNALMEAGARADDAEDWARARAIYKDVNAIEPDFADGWARGAASAWQMKDHASAVADLKRAVQLEPRHFAAWAGLATIYEEIGYLEAADQAWNEALYWHPLMDAARRGAARTGASLRGLSL
jgi:tetratricopeptide (TPR) repeat protein